MSIPIFQVDAFTDKLFMGNPAAVCIFDKWPIDNLLQDIAAENNLAETAFIVPHGKDYEIRWFTPTVEVDLCGHATLASGYVVFNIFKHNEETITFISRKSGHLKVSRGEEILALDFPADSNLKDENPAEVLNALGIISASYVKRGKTDILVVLDKQKDLEAVNPDMALLNQINARGIIVTAPGKEVDFVSRFFGPKVGVPEDPVTGSAHTTLIPYWSKELNKKQMVARQLSKRGGTLYCTMAGDRVTIGGEAALYMKGQIEINDR